jgi:hypothetical protein
MQRTAAVAPEASGLALLLSKCRTNDSSRCPLELAQTSQTRGNFQILSIELTLDFKEYPDLQGDVDRRMWQPGRNSTATHMLVEKRARNIMCYIWLRNEHETSCIISG